MTKEKRWFARRPRYHLHFTPTSASWLNQLERFFGLLTNRRIRRGTFGSVRELESAIRDYLAHHNEIPNRSSGLPMPTQSSKRSSVFVYELLTQDTSEAPPQTDKACDWVAAFAGPQRCSKRDTDDVCVGSRVQTRRARACRAVLRKCCRST